MPFSFLSPARQVRKLSEMRSILFQSSLCAAFLLLAGWSGAAGAQEPDPLDRPARLAHEYVTFDDALELLKTATALPVVCPEDTARVMRRLLDLKNFPTTGQDDLVEHSHPVKELLNRVCGDLNLQWKYDPQKQEIAVDCPWRTTDARPAADLFKAIWRPGHEDAFYDDDSWWVALNGLLSKPENFPAACKVQQAAGLHSLFRGFSEHWDQTRIGASLGRIIEQPVVSAGGGRYHCVFLIRNMQASPGHGWMAYYWFNDNGTLVGADLMNTGYRLIVDSLQVHDLRSGGKTPSEVIITAHHNNNGKPTPAFFVLTEHGLQLSEDSGLGQSIIAPLK